MSCLLRIQESSHDFTDTEKKIADYIVVEKSHVINYSVQELAKKTNTSPAAVVRFSKKIGYKGYMNLKVDLAQDIKNDRVKTDNIVREDDEISVLIQKAKNSSLDTLDKTYQLLDEDLLLHAILTMRHAKRIFLLGIGGSAIVCYDLHQKLLRVNVDSRFEMDYHVQLAALNHITKDDVCIAISYSGDTEEIVYALKYAKEQGAKTIGITRFGKTPIQKYLNIALQIPHTEKEYRLGSILSRFSFLAVTDLLYYGVVQESLDRRIETIVKTRELTKGLHKN
ncbi:hypothetical protein AOC36_03275 [Erysipelothrix larvae]|uniref:RpiR family transcriptional regulator n=1 Tax=Erysipelothrix larvae TaxID=1514105 RepID=A0A0X8GZ16_9FIRM|nr:MurR/RpiR family transcriptional regulator [Erysipelothrix larvae]AMC93037.1 hypothetical protein AOC36_03275 [Erysipelothrix larvae]